MFNKDIIRSLQLINYDRSKTLLEQGDGSLDFRHSHSSGGSTGKVRKKTYVDTYPSNCAHPDKAQMPPDVNGLPGLIEGYCFYQVPSGGGMHFPEDAFVKWADQNTYAKAMSRVLKRARERGDFQKYTGATDYTPDGSTWYTEEQVFEDFSKFVVGAASNFSLGENSVRFTGHIRRSTQNTHWSFVGYYSDDLGEWYKQPEWVDTRTEYQQFIDEWGLIIQLSLAVITIVLTAGGAAPAWVFALEVVLELGVGTAVGLRELEKGENVAAAFSFLTGALPLLKGTKMFNGIKAADLSSLSSKMSKANLTTKTTLKDYLKFYDTLNEGEKTLLTILTKRDEFLSESLRALGGVDDITKAVILDLAENSPDVLKTVPFMKRLWVRELGANVGVGILGWIVDSLWGKQLNDAEKQSIEWVFVQYPELQMELIYNIINNPENIGEYTEVTDELKSEEFNNQVKNKKDKLDIAIVKMRQTPNHEVIEDSPQGPEFVRSNERKIEKAKEKGWFVLEKGVTTPVGTITFVESRNGEQIIMGHSNENEPSPF